MPNLGDEKEFKKGNVIKERPSKKDDDDADDIAVYGSEDDDVVTGDEMDDEGNFDPDAGLDDGSGEGDDGSGVDIDFEDGEEDDLADFEDDDVEDAPSDDDGEGLEDDEFGDDVGEGDADEALDLLDQLKDIIKKISGGEDKDIEDFDDDELEESFARYFLGKITPLKTLLTNSQKALNSKLLTFMTLSIQCVKQNQILQLLSIQILLKKTLTTFAN